MKSAQAKVPENKSLEDLGRATLQIVHDLKNQLNGLKLYATFLRKRLETAGGLQEERETLVKLIAGIDRAAGEMNALVRYARPVELRRQPQIDLRRLLVDAAHEVSATFANGTAQESIAIESEGNSLAGNFDPAAVSEALKAITRQALGGHSTGPEHQPSLHLHRVDQISPEALIEWRGAKLDERKTTAGALANSNLHAALAGKIIEAHGGRVEYAPNIIRAWLPLSE